MNKLDIMITYGNTEVIHTPEKIVIKSPNKEKEVASIKLVGAIFIPILPTVI